MKRRMCVMLAAAIFVIAPAGAQTWNGGFQASFAEIQDLNDLWEAGVNFSFTDSEGILRSVTGDNPVKGYHDYQQ